jgi:hypothetical protein
MAMIPTVLAMEIGSLAGDGNAMRRIKRQALSPR